MTFSNIIVDKSFVIQMIYYLFIKKKKNDLLFVMEMYQAQIPYIYIKELNMTLFVMYW